MAYSTNPDRVVDLLPWMTVLLAGTDCKWDFSNSKTPPQTFAYRLREALYIAKLYPGKFPPVEAIADDLVVEVDGSIVYARHGKVMRAPLPDPIGQYASQQTAFSHSTAPAPIRYSLSTITALWSKRQSSSIMLPMYVPDDAELLQLYQWGLAQSPAVMLMPADTELTLIEYDVNLAGMNWEPEGMPQPEEKS